MGILINLILSAVAVFLASYILPGVTVDGFVSALIAAAVLGIINAILKPVLVILTLPINIISLGLFTFVINAFLILLTSKLVTGFHVNGFMWALILSFLLSIINFVLHSLSPVE